MNIEAKHYKKQSKQTFIRFSCSKVFSDLRRARLSPKPSSLHRAISSLYDLPQSKDKIVIALPQSDFITSPSTSNLLYDALYCSERHASTMLKNMAKKEQYLFLRMSDLVRASMMALLFDPPPALASLTTSSSPKSVSVTLASDKILLYQVCESRNKQFSSLQ